LESFTELTNLDEIKKYIMNSKFSRKDSGKSLAEAPDDQKVDDLVEKCGSISARNSDILKFPTLLDYIIFLNTRKY
jgi:choline kinase